MKNKSIILAFIFAAGILAVVFLTRVSDRAPQKAAVGLDAPLFELKDTEGRIWKLSDFRNKVVLLNFWATWCDSCKGENPSIQRLVNIQKGNGNFVFISVLFRDTPSNAVEYMKTNGFSFPVLIDDGDIASRYGLKGVPETFMIDKKGILRHKIIGPITWDTPDVIAAIQKLTAESS